VTRERRGAADMKKTPARIALPLLAAFLVTALGGCKLPYQILSKLVKPKPTPTATPLPALPAKEIQAEFNQINDERVQGEGNTASASIYVDLPGTKRSEVAATRVVTKKVVDDLGTDLVPEKATDAGFEPVNVNRGYGQEDGAVTVTVPMKTTSRKAKMLKEVTADVELYTPALDPAALVTIPKYLGEAGKPIVSQVLKDAGVDIAILSPAQIEAERKALGEKKRAEVKGTGVTADIVEMHVKWAVESFLNLSEGDVVLKLTDPGSRIQGLVFLDSEGEAKQPSRNSRDGFEVLSYGSDSANPDWGLQIHLKTPKSFQRYTFTLKDIALP
jgi:hypothetical protein